VAWKRLHIGPWITVQPTLRGLNQFTARMAPEDLFKSVRGSLEEVLTELHRDVVRSTPEASGDTRLGIAIDINGTTIENLNGRVFSQDEHFRILEFGRTPGAKMPPAGPIRKWMQDVGIEDDLKGSVLFTIRRRIGRRGLPALYIMHEALTRQRPSFKVVFMRRFIEDWNARH